MVKGADRVDRQDRGARVSFGSSAEETADGFGAAPRAEAILGRQTRFLQAWREMLRQYPTDESSEDVTNDQGPHSAIGLALGDHAPDPDARQSFFWDTGLRQELCGPVQQAAIILLIKQ